MCLNLHAPRDTKFNTYNFSSTTLTNEPIESPTLTSFVAINYVESNDL